MDCKRTYTQRINVEDNVGKQIFLKIKYHPTRPTSPVTLNVYC